MRLGVLVVVVAMSTVPAWTVDVPATAPNAAEIRDLVQQLGHEEFAVRENATEQLRKIGLPALPALKAAAGGSDLEVRQRAESLLRVIERRPVPGPRPGVMPLTTGLRISNENGRKLVEVTENGRTIRIVESEDGIEMQVTGFIDGKQVTEEYAARSAEELKKDNPEAAELYAQYGTGLGGITVINGQVIIGGPAFGPAQLRPRLDDLDMVDVRLREQLAKSKLPVAEQKKLLDQLDGLKQMQQLDPAATQDERDKRMEEFLTACDGFRDKLAELKLPGVGEALPPRAGARLGIEVRSGGDGLTVARVLPASRGERVGLKGGDVILKMAGTEVKDVADLRRLASENKSLVVDVEREGEDIQLKEPAAPTTKP